MTAAETVGAVIGTSARAQRLRRRRKLKQDFNGGSTEDCESEEEDDEKAVDERSLASNRVDDDPMLELKLWTALFFIALGIAIVVSNAFGDRFIISHPVGTLWADHAFAAVFVLFAVGLLTALGFQKY